MQSNKTTELLALKLRILSENIPEKHKVYADHWNGIPGTNGILSGTERKIGNWNGTGTEQKIGDWNGTGTERKIRDGTIWNGTTGIYGTTFLACLSVHLLANLSVDKIGRAHV